MSDEQMPGGGDQTPASEAQRDARGRFVKGYSGNAAGKPAGIMNAATRIAAALLTARAPEIMAAAIDRALAGRDATFKILPRPHHRAATGSAHPI